MGVIVAPDGDFRPEQIERHGTKVTLLGMSEENNTCFPPEDAAGDMDWT